MESFEIIHPGLFTTVQDLGRIGYLKYGIPQSGAVDNFSLRIGNLLVGNHESAAGLEITLMGPKIKVLKDGNPVTVNQFSTPAGGENAEPSQ